MPRVARIIGPHYPHHVIQRGNNRSDVFYDQADRRFYLSLLRKYSEKWDARVLAYCLMSNHVHLLVRPSRLASLPKLMQGVGLCYTQAVNRKYDRTGRLWESRYFSSVVEEERYLWAVTRYIEQNPVRAGLTTQPEEYPYSSASAHVLGTADPVIGESIVDFQETGAYSAFMQSSPSDEINLIRRQTRLGKPIGTERFNAQFGVTIGRSTFRRPHGQPRLAETQLS